MDDEETAPGEVDGGRAKVFPGYIFWRGFSFTKKTDEVFPSFLFSPLFGDILPREAIRADHSSINAQRPSDGQEQNFFAGLEKMPAKKRCLRARVYQHPEKAEFRASQSGARPLGQRHGSDLLHPRGRAQFAGTLDCVDPRRACQGSSGSPVSHHPGNIGYRGCPKSQTRPFQIRL